MQKTIFKCCFTLIAVCVAFEARAQAIESSINLYGINFPQEKIHIHFDKESYLPGETIWFKAYTFEENLPSERSTNLYVALYDEYGKLLQQRISPLFKGTSDGHFDIPDSLPSSQLICRAYTAWMLNFDTTMLFSRAIKIIGNKNDSIIKSGKTVSLHFFAEGGDVIEGVVNTIAFKANYNDGSPFFTDGVIKKQETGEVMMPLTIMHDGMGKFDLEFQPGNRYYAEWLDNTGVKMQTMLPDAKPTGVSLKVSVQKDRLYFNLQNKTGTDSLHIVMYMYQKVFYKTNIAVKAGEPFTAMVPVSGLPSGTMQLTVFDAGWNPVAERVAFINNNNFTINAAANTVEINTGKRNKNVLEILVADTVPANMSLSITDADMNNEIASNTIVSDFLLKGDVKGYIHNPAFYFTNNADASLKSKLDLVMLTHGWRRYNWTDMMVQKTPAVKFLPDEYLGVYGQITKTVMDTMRKDETVNLVVKTADSASYFYSIKPERTGILKQTGLVFYDSARIYFSFNKNKVINNQIAFSKFNFTKPLLHPISNYKDLLIKDAAVADFDTHASLYQYYLTSDSIKKFNKEQTLKSVVVKSRARRTNWQNDPLVKMDERYASGMFTGGATGYAFDVLHDEKAWTKPDIYNYIRGTMPSLLIGNFNLTNGRSLTYNGKTVLIYIDEHEMTTSDLENLSLSQVAYIKLIPYFLGSGPEAGGAGLQPALSVYTRKGDDLIDRRPTDKDLGMVKIAGYSPFKEFYSPDYSQSNTETATDARTTLIWVPYILTDKNNRKVPVTFYNNDFTKRMRVILEGINDEGKMIRIEKIIE
ncbi:MAG: hypothetical protein JNM14_07410 [Ferruginibacter sp.]|nr:hypothetical protein [Ferruginibacter sp.]